MKSRMLPFLLLVLIHLLSNLQMDHPIVMADELGYLGHARFLAGRAPLPNMEGARFYHFGYSLLLVPAFWVLSSPVWAYRAALTVNALLMSSLFLPLTSILERVLETPARVAKWIAFTCCLYPPLILFSNFAWSENAFIPLYAGTAALFGIYLRLKSHRSAILFGLTLGALYTIHPRALPVLVISVVYLVVLVFLRVLEKRQVLLGVAATAAVFTLTRVGIESLEALAWGGTGEFSALQLGSRLLPGGQIKSLILRAAGQLLYLSLSTYGLFLLGVMVTVGLLWRRARSESPRRLLVDPRSAVLIFLVLSGSGIFLGSTALKVYSLFGRNTLRAANFIYGRYNEAFAVVMAAVALAYLCRESLRESRPVWRELAVGVAMLALTGLVMFQIDSAIHSVGPEVPWLVEAINIAGVFPWVDLLGMPRLYWISGLAMIVFLLISASIGRSYRAALILVMILFSWGSIYSARVNIAPALEASRERLSFVPQVAQLGPIETLDYDFAFRDYQVFYGAQYLMQDTVFRKFDSRRDEEPVSEVVISGKSWNQAERLGAKFLTAAAAGDTALWVLPGELQSRLPVPQYDDLNLASEPRWGILEAGFYPAESIGGSMARWTNGAASLRVPVEPRKAPRWLEIETIDSGQPGGHLQVVVNGFELWNEPISNPWSNVFRLEDVPTGTMLTIELNSDTLNPYREIEGAKDNRDLGVLVRTIRLTSEASRDPASFLGMTLGAEKIRGVLESGFYPTERFGESLARWTNGAGKLQVPLDPRRLPRELEVDVSAPGREGVQLLVRVNGVELWHDRVSDRGTSIVLDLREVPLRDSLLIELVNRPFIPSQTQAGSTDTRRLGVVVEGVRLRRSASSRRRW